jgi:hypothetical protein
MSDLRELLQKTLSATGPIPREQVVAWSRMAGDIESLRLLYELTDVAYDRIQPSLGQEETCGVIRRYLLTCISADPKDGRAFARYEAARVLVGWFQHLSDMPEETADVLQASAAAVTQLYLGGNDDVKTAIETGFLEHVLEDEEFRPLFSDWAQDDRLREAWNSALAWGKAHPGFTRRLTAGGEEFGSG